MNYLSVCSGIEAATVGWHSLGWQPVAFSEIEPFPCAALAHHYPDVPNWGDMTKFKEWPDAAIDVLVGGTPCQSFSVAGLRKGLDDPRGNLMLTYLAIAAKYRPKWVVWENVPGVLSSNGGNDFASLLQGLGELGYGFAYRILDAQHFGVPQRRRRVFVVGHIGDWQRAAAVFFERHSLQGHTPPSREAGKRVAKTVTASLGTGGADYDTKELIGGIDYENNGHGPTGPTGPLLKGSPTGGGRPLPAIVQAHRQVAFGEYVNDDTASTMKQRDYKDATDLVTHSLRGESFDASEDGTGRGTPLAMQVRRLTPRECERLQGFPDDYTQVPYRNKPAADGPRYKALGNSMAVPVMAWIGKRIQQVEEITCTTKQKYHSA